MLKFRTIGSARPRDEPGLSGRAGTLLRLLPSTRQPFSARQRLVREGERQGNCYVILSGVTHRHRVTAEGQRQIIGFHVPGDIVGLCDAADGPARQSIEAAGPVTAAVIGLSQLVQAARTTPEIADVLWREAVATAAVASEWIVNIGQRSARERILNLFCELSLRLEQAGVSSREQLDLPLTQADLADATGLTAVHVNRVIRSLEVEGVITRSGRMISLKNWSSIAGQGDFDPSLWTRENAALAAR